MAKYSNQVLGITLLQTIVMNTWIYRPRAFRANDDVVYEIEPQYNYRPDLLAYDLYGNPKLWWVFAQRNMDTVLDPIYDIKVGRKIYLPKGSSLKSVLGV